MNKRVEISKLYLVASAFVVLLAGFAIGTRSDQLFATIGPLVGIRVATGELNDDKLQSTYRTLKAYYNGTLDKNKLIEGAAAGMVSAAGDPYTVYLSAKDAEKFNNELSGNIGGGIGAEIGLRKGKPAIIRTLADNPAREAGLHAGDFVVSVNDQQTTGWDVEQTVTAIRGEIGTTVRIVVDRANQKKEFSITRAEINNPSVTSEINGQIGIITLTRFDQDTVKLVRQAAERLKTRGMKKLVLDMRGNGGGYLDAAPGVAGMWLSNKLVVSVKASGGSEDKLYSEGDQILRGVPTVILTNAGTASAAEIVTAALKHYGIAKVMGEKSFGKGTVQELVPLSGGAMLKVTIKRWYTPSGVNVTGKGIKPNKAVELTQKSLDEGKDTQLDAALDYLR